MINYSLNEGFAGRSRGFSAKNTYGDERYMMSVVNKEVHPLVERMTDALTEVSMGQPRHVVIDAVVHAAAALVTGCVGPKAAPDALAVCATIFAARAEEARKAGIIAKTSSSQPD